MFSFHTSEIQYETSSDRAVEPEQKHDGDAGVDVSFPRWSDLSDLAEDCEILPKEAERDPGVNYLFSEELEDKYSESINKERKRCDISPLTEGLAFHDDDVGFFLPPGIGISVNLRLKLRIPNNIFVEIQERSSTPIKKGLIATGRVIDPGYRGEIHAMLWNQSNKATALTAGDRLVQLVPKISPPFEVTEHAGETERSAAGLGSTGE